MEPNKFRDHVFIVIRRLSNHISEYPKLDVVVVLNQDYGMVCFAHTLFVRDAANDTKKMCIHGL